jgi:hypothetical protein
LDPITLDVMKLIGIALASVAVTGVVLALASGIGQPARADCMANGYKYPEGAIVNGRVCRKGSWQ